MVHLSSNYADMSESHGLLLLVLARELVISLKKTQSATQMLRLSSMDHGSVNKIIYTPSPPHLNPKPMVTCLNRRTTLYWGSGEGRARFFLSVTDRVGKK